MIFLEILYFIIFLGDSSWKPGGRKKVRMCTTITPKGKMYFLDETKIEIVRYTFLLEFEDFSEKVRTVEMNQEYGSSSTITFLGEDGCLKSWDCKFYPRGLKDSNNTNLHFVIWRDVTENIGESIQLSILNPEMKKVKTGIGKKKKKKRGTDDSIMFLEYLISPIQLPVILDPAKKILSDNGTLNVLIECDVAIQTINKTTRVINFDMPDSIVQKNLSKFFHDDKFKDVVLKVKGFELKAHKIVLAAQSPVFSRMFDQEEGMIDFRNNRVRIDDVNPEVAKQMLEFIYTDKEPSGIDVYAKELLVAAQKYQLKRLSIMCEEILARKISLDTALITFIFADTNKLKILRKTAVEFIYMHRTLLEKEEFRDFERNHPHLAIEIYQEITSVKRRRTDPGPSHEN